MEYTLDYLLPKRLPMPVINMCIILLKGYSHVTALIVDPSINIYIHEILLVQNLKKVREKSRECHNHKPQPFPDPKRKRKPTNLNNHKLNKRTKKH